MSSGISMRGLHNTNVSGPNGPTSSSVSGVTTEMQKATTTTTSTGSVLASANPRIRAPRKNSTTADSIKEAAAAAASLSTSKPLAGPKQLGRAKRVLRAALYQAVAVAAFSEPLRMRGPDGVTPIAAATAETKVPIRKEANRTTATLLISVPNDAESAAPPSISTMHARYLPIGAIFLLLHPCVRPSWWCTRLPLARHMIAEPLAWHPCLQQVMDGARVALRLPSVDMLVQLVGDAASGARGEPAIGAVRWTGVDATPAGWCNPGRDVYGPSCIPVDVLASLAKDCSSAHAAARAVKAAQEKDTEAAACGMSKKPAGALSNVTVAAPSTAGQLLKPSQYALPLLAMPRSHVEGVSSTQQPSATGGSEGGTATAPPAAVDGVAVWRWHLDVAETPRMATGCSIVAASRVPGGVCVAGMTASSNPSTPSWRCIKSDADFAAVLADHVKSLIGAAAIDLLQRAERQRVNESAQLTDAEASGVNASSTKQSPSAAVKLQPGRMRIRASDLRMMAITASSSSTSVTSTSASIEAATALASIKPLGLRLRVSVGCSCCWKEPLPGPVASPPVQVMVDGNTRIQGPGISGSLVRLPALLVPKHAVEAAPLVHGKHGDIRSHDDAKAGSDTGAFNPMLGLTIGSQPLMSLDSVLWAQRCGQGSGILKGGEISLSLAGSCAVKATPAQGPASPTPGSAALIDACGAICLPLVSSLARGPAWMGEGNVLIDQGTGRIHLGQCHVPGCAAGNNGSAASAVDDGSDGWAHFTDARGRWDEAQLNRSRMLVRMNAKMSCARGAVARKALMMQLKDESAARQAVEARMNQARMEAQARAVRRRAEEELREAEAALAALVGGSGDADIGGAHGLGVPSIDGSARQDAYTDELVPSGGDGCNDRPSSGGRCSTASTDQRQHSRAGSRERSGTGSRRMSTSSMRSRPSTSDDEHALLSRPASGQARLAITSAGSHRGGGHITQLMLHHMALDGEPTGTTRPASALCTASSRRGSTCSTTSHISHGHESSAHSIPKAATEGLDSRSTSSHPAAGAAVDADDTIIANSASGDPLSRAADDGDSAVSTNALLLTAIMGSATSASSLAPMPKTAAASADNQAEVLMHISQAKHRGATSSAFSSKHGAAAATNVMASNMTAASAAERVAAARAALAAAAASEFSMQQKLHEDSERSGASGHSNTHRGSPDTSAVTPYNSSAASLGSASGDSGGIHASITASTQRLLNSIKSVEARAGSRDQSDAPERFKAGAPSITELFPSLLSINNDGSAPASLIDFNNAGDGSNSSSSTANYQSMHGWLVNGRGGSITAADGNHSRQIRNAAFNTSNGNADQGLARRGSRSSEPGSGRGGSAAPGSTEYLLIAHQLQLSARHADGQYSGRARNAASHSASPRRDDTSSTAPMVAASGMSAGAPDLQPSFVISNSGGSVKRRHSEAAAPNDRSMVKTNKSAPGIVDLSATMPLMHVGGLNSMINSGVITGKPPRAGGALTGAVLGNKASDAALKQLKHDDSRNHWRMPPGMSISQAIAAGAISVGNAKPPAITSQHPMAATVVAAPVSQQRWSVKGVAYGNATATAPTQTTELEPAVATEAAMDAQAASKAVSDGSLAQNRNEQHRNRAEQTAVPIINVNLAPPSAIEASAHAEVVSPATFTGSGTLSVPTSLQDIGPSASRHSAVTSFASRLGPLITAADRMVHGLHPRRLALLLSPPRGQHSGTPAKSSAGSPMFDSVSPTNGSCNVTGSMPFASSSPGTGSPADAGNKVDDVGSLTGFRSSGATACIADDRGPSSPAPSMSVTVPGMARGTSSLLSPSIVINGRGSTDVNSVNGSVTWYPRRGGQASPASSPSPSHSSHGTHDSGRPLRAEHRGRFDSSASSDFEPPAPASITRNRGPRMPVIGSPSDVDDVKVGYLPDQPDRDLGSTPGQSGEQGGPPGPWPFLHAGAHPAALHATTVLVTSSSGSISSPNPMQQPPRFNISKTTTTAASVRPVKLQPAKAGMRPPQFSDGELATSPTPPPSAGGSYYYYGYRPGTTATAGGGGAMESFRGWSARNEDGLIASDGTDTPNSAVQQFRIGASGTQAPHAAAGANALGSEQQSPIAGYTPPPRGVGPAIGAPVANSDGRARLSDNERALAVADGGAAYSSGGVVSGTMSGSPTAVKTYNSYTLKLAANTDKTAADDITGTIDSATSRSGIITNAGCENSNSSPAARARTSRNLIAVHYHDDTSGLSLAGSHFAAQQDSPHSHHQQHTTTQHRRINSNTVPKANGLHGTATAATLVQRTADGANAVQSAATHPSLTPATAWVSTPCPP